MSGDFDETYRRIREFERARGPLRDVQAAVDRQKHLQYLNLDALNAGLDILEAARATSPMFPAPAYWESLQGITLAMQQAVDSSVARHLASLSRTAYLAGSALYHVDPMLIGSRLRLEAGVATPFIKAVEAHSEAFSDLVVEIGENLPEEVYVDELTDQASASAFTQGEMVRALAGAEGDPETSDERQELRLELSAEFSDALTGLLAKFGNHYIRNWQGAKYALRGDNPDKARHVLASLRTLWDDLVDVIAPEKEARKGATAGDYHTTPDGRQVLKREVRFRYIGRFIGFNRLAAAWIADAEALVKVYGMLNSVHFGELEIADEELEMIVLRTESALLMMIRASQLRDK